MALPITDWKKEPKAAAPGPRMVSAYFTTSTSGTIGSTQAAFGCTVTKTASETGRYTIQLVDTAAASTTAVRFLGGFASIIGPDDAAMTDAKGIMYVWRDDDLASDGTIELQFVDADSGADAELQDSAKVALTLFVADSDK